jgi:radical SAM-linked protein
VLERAWRAGARFDGWDEWFRPHAWSQAFASAGLDPESYAYRQIDPESRLPWDVIDPGVSRDWLAVELRRALAGVTLPVCGPHDCHGCAPFAGDCVKGVVARTNRRPLDAGLPLLSTPAAPGPEPPATADQAPPRHDGGDAPSPSAPLPVRRYRARFRKGGRLRFLGHLDLTRTLLRALRRAGLPLIYSRGFNPKPRVSFGPALAVGVASEAEYLDFELSRPIPVPELLEKINGALPAALRFDALREIGDRVPALGDAIRAARYRGHVTDGTRLAEALAAFEKGGLARVRRAGKDGKERMFELQEEVLGLAPRDERSFSITLAHRPGRASLRPDEALSVILGDLAQGLRLVREELLVDWKGRLVDPLLAGAAASGSDAAGTLR